MELQLNSEQITLQSKSNFLYSFFFLPREKRQAIYTLYAFCRQTDDIADNNAPMEMKMRLLNWWENELKNCFVKRASNYFSAVRQVAERFRIPFELFLELIAGVRMDLQNRQYGTFDELKLYCYRVASTVGLMSIQIFGYRDPAIKLYAENLGIALQLTNIIRDVAVDARMGRIYLPASEMEKFNVSPEQILEKKFTPNFEQLMRYQAKRARNYYQLAAQHLPPQEKRNMLVAEIMKNIYLTILKRIEAQHFNVLEHTIKLSTPAKLGIIFKTVTHSKMAR